MSATGVPLLIRRWTDTSRLKEVLAIVHESFGSLAIDPPSSAMKENVADFAGRLRDEILFVAEDGGRVLGSVCCKPAADALYVGRLAVAADARRSGVGHALMAAAENEALRRGLSRMTLRVRIALPENVAFFRRRGFAVTAEECHPGYTQPTSYAMERLLDRSRDL
jgi:GNAT superfamily N-acetyltransferase